MPTLINDIAIEFSLSKPQKVKWNESICTQEEGVYLVSSSDNPSLNLNTQDDAPISRKIIDKWIENNEWVSYLAESLDKKYISNTSITFKIKEKWFINKAETDQRNIMKEICKLLEDNNVAYDINGYAKAPPSFRIWGGGTVETTNVEKLLPWINWAYNEIRNKYA